MARPFEIIGADRRTGVDLTFTLEAEDAEQAQELANTAGVIVSEVRPLPPPLPARLAEPQTAPTDAAAPLIPLPVISLSTPSRPWSAQKVRRWQAGAVIVLLCSAWLMAYCANALADGEERLRPLRNAAEASHARSPGVTSYVIQPYRDYVEVREIYTQPKQVTGITRADDRLAAEQMRQVILRVGLHGAPALAAAAVGAAVFARRKARGS